MSYEDKESYTICNIQYSATMEDANRVSMEADKLVEFQEWIQADSFIKMGHFDTDTPAKIETLRAACLDAELAHARATRAVHKMLKRMDLL